MRGTKVGLMGKRFGFCYGFIESERVCYILLAKTLKFNIKENEDAAWNLGITLLSIDKCLHMTYNCILLARKQRIEMSSVYLLHVSIVPPSIHAIVNLSAG